MRKRLADFDTVRLFDHKLSSAMTCLLHFPHWSGQIKKSTSLPTGLSILLAYIWDLRHFLIFSSRTHLSTLLMNYKRLVYKEKATPSSAHLTRVTFTVLLSTELCMLLSHNAVWSPMHLMDRNMRKLMATGFSSANMVVLILIHLYITSWRFDALQISWWSSNSEILEESIYTENIPEMFLKSSNMIAIIVQHLFEIISHILINAKEPTPACVWKSIELNHL